VLRRFVLLIAAAVLLQGCPALIEDEYRAVDELPGVAGSSGVPGAGGRLAGGGGSSGSVAADAGGSSGGEVPAGVGGGAGTPGSGATGGIVVVGLGGATTGGGTGTGGTGGATGGVTGVGGATGGVGASGGAAGEAGATAGSAGTPGGAAGSAGSAGMPGGAAGSAGTAGVPGGAAGTAGSAGSAGTAGSMGGTGGTDEPFCPTSPTDCIVLQSALIHRYRFDGTGTTVADSVGDADGIVMGGASLSGDGELTLAGGSSGQYVNLPNHLISVLDAVTIETWVVWQGGTAWQRVFDFGDAMANSCYDNGPSAPEGQQGECGRTFLMITPRNEDSVTGVVHASFMRQPGTPPDDDLEVRGSAATIGSVMHLAVVVDEAGDSIGVYVDGELEGSESFTYALSDLNEINNWLGRSQFVNDASRGFHGTYLEFRIYDAALSESEVATSFTEGSDPAFLE
jgi:hypothetical protein